MLSRNLPWTKEDDERLRAFVVQGASVIRAAAALRRTTIDSALAPVRSVAHSRSCGSSGRPMKFATERPFANPEATARKLIEIANSVEAVKDGRIYIELINAPFLYEHKGSPAEYKASLELAITRGWLTLDRSGTFVKFTQAGAVRPDGQNRIDGGT